MRFSFRSTDSITIRLYRWSKGIFFYFRLLYENFKISIDVLLIVLILLGVTWFADRRILGVVEQLGLELNITHFQSDIPGLIEIHASIIGAILGLLFALYILGFQTSTQKYSRDVAEYIVQEPVERSLVRTFLVAILFDLSVLTLITFENLPGLFALFIVSFLTIIVLISIKSYRDHHLLGSHPKNLFRRLRGEFQNAVRLALDTNTWNSSPTIVYNESVKALEKLKLAYKLYSDLYSKQDENNIYGQKAIIAMLKYYVVTKHRIVRHQDVWNQTRYTPLEDNFITVHLRDTLSRQGFGDLEIPLSYVNWLEDEFLGIFHQIHRNALQVESGLDYSNSHNEQLIRGYANLLVGDLVRTSARGLPSNDKPLFQAQDFYLLDEIVQLFIEAWSFAQKTEGLSRAYIQILQGFERPSQEFIDQMIFGSQFDDVLINNRNTRLNAGELNEYRRIIENEQNIEGKLVTPRPYIVENYFDSIERTELEKIEKYFPVVVSQFEVCTSFFVDTKEFDLHLEAIRLKMTLVTKAMFEARLTTYNYIDNLILNSDIKFLIINHENYSKTADSIVRQIINMELYSLYNKLREPYNKFLLIRFTFFFLTLNQKDTLKSHYTIHQIAHEGALAFIASELNDDQYWIKTFVEQLFKFWENRDLKQLTSSLRTVVKETSPYYISLDSLYTTWFDDIYERIRDLPSRQVKAGGQIPFNFYDHKSEFIRKIQVDDIVGQWGFRRKCIQGFLDYLDTTNNPGDQLCSTI